MMLATSGSRSRSGSVVKAAGVVPRYVFMFLRRITVASTRTVIQETFPELVEDSLLITCSSSLLANHWLPMVCPIWLILLSAVTRNISHSLELVLEHLLQLSSPVKVLQKTQNVLVIPFILVFLQMSSWPQSSLARKNREAGQSS